MKRRLIIMILAMLAVVPATAAQAAALTAADLAADCEDDGEVIVTGYTLYNGGAETIGRDCAFRLTKEATLILANVELFVDGHLVVNPSPEGTSVYVLDSVIEATSSLELTAGCCSGDSAVAENDGTVVVKRSKLVAEAVLMIASTDSAGGFIAVAESSITATGTLGVHIRASTSSGTDGIVWIEGSEIFSASNLRIATGQTGYTAVVDTATWAAGTTLLTAGLGGSCDLWSNTPTLICT